jgi:hypothetical protein
MDFAAIITIGGLVSPFLFWFLALFKNDLIIRKKMVNKTRTSLREFITLLLCVYLGIISLGFLLRLPLMIVMPTPSALMETQLHYFLIFPRYNQVSSPAYHQSIAAVAWILTWPTILVAFAIISIIYFKSLSLPRLYIPVRLAAIILVGALFYSILFFYGDLAINTELIYRTSTLSFSVSPHLAIPAWIIRSINTLLLLSRASLLAILILLQSYLGPIFTGYLLSAGTFQFMHYHEIGILATTRFFDFTQLPLIINPVLNLIFKDSPKSASTIFLMSQFTYNILINSCEIYRKHAFSWLQSYPSQLIVQVRKMLSLLVEQLRALRASLDGLQWKKKRTKSAHSKYKIISTNANESHKNKEDEWDLARDAIVKNLRELDKARLSPQQSLKEITVAVNHGDRQIVRAEMRTQLNITHTSENAISMGRLNETQLEEVAAGGSYWITSRYGENWLYPTEQTLKGFSQYQPPTGIFTYIRQSISAAEVLSPARLRLNGPFWSVVEPGTIAVPG